MGKIRIGTSGWNYSEWRGPFYPEDLPKSHELRYVGERFGTVEVNATFYSLAKPSTFRRWYEAMPDDGVVALKGSRFITHNKKLNDVDGPLANFFASGVLELEDKLGPILWQLPDTVSVDAERIDRFLAVLPHDTESLAALASNHDDRVPEASLRLDGNHRVRHVLEVRHRDHLTERVAGIARTHGVALAFSHSSEWDYTEEITGGFVYLRLHGPGRVYSSSYGEDGLRRWADRIGLWRAGEEPPDARRLTNRQPPARKERDVYVYFDNDGGGHAPREALRLTELLAGA